MFLVESLWESSELFIRFPPSVVVRLQFRNFIHVKWAVLRIEVGDIFSRQDLQVVVPCVLQLFKELQIKRIANFLADASA